MTHHDKHDADDDDAPMTLPTRREWRALLARLAKLEAWLRTSGRNTEALDAELSSRKDTP